MIRHVSDKLVTEEAAHVFATSVRKAAGHAWGRRLNGDGLAGDGVKTGAERHREGGNGEVEHGCSLGANVTLDNEIMVSAGEAARRRTAFGAFFSSRLLDSTFTHHRPRSPRPSSPSFHASALGASLASVPPLSLHIPLGFSSTPPARCLRGDEGLPPHHFAIGWPVQRRAARRAHEAASIGSRGDDPLLLT